MRIPALSRAVLAVSLAACSTPVAVTAGHYAHDSGENADVGVGTDAALPTDSLADAVPSETADSAATDATADAGSEIADAVVDATSAEISAETSAAETKADAPVKDVPAAGAPFAEITSPATGGVVEDGKPVDLAGIATDSLYAPADLVAAWASDVDGDLGTSVPDSSGKVSLKLAKLSPGQHTISLTVTEPSGVSAVSSISIGVCSWSKPDTFDTVVSGSKWKIYGDAYFDPGGWLEMTGNAQSKKGQIFNISDFVSPGDVQISFKIATGGFLTSSGQSQGADGFALSVIDVKTVKDLENVLSVAGKGGCLGYGVAGDCHPDGKPGLDVSAFHIEIDTWHNSGDPNYDPTSQNHIGIMQNGDATNHYLWANVPSIVDLQWHVVTVEVKGNNVRVTLDTKEIINDKIPNFKFRGGFIGFSGTTGWATNYHRFDDLQILQQCTVK